MLFYLQVRLFLCIQVIARDYIKIVTAATKNVVIKMGNGSAMLKLGFVLCENRTFKNHKDVTYYIPYTRNSNC